jgi:hypothetical protein
MISPICRNGVGRVPITAFDVCGDRHAHRAGNARGGGDHFGPRRFLAIGIAERPGDPAAGGGDGLEARRLEQAGAQRIPGIGQQQERGREVPLAERFRQR